MKKYFAFFRLRFSISLQYRAAALAGLITQFAWGAMRILAFRAFYRADASAFPMDFQATSNYIWLQQAFLALFMFWGMEADIFDSIRNGNIAYEICRPVGIYEMWFSRTAALRLSRAVLRCFPILLVAAFLPAPYGLTLSVSISAFLWFLLAMVLAFLLVISGTLLVYLSCFFTISPRGIRIIVSSLAEFLQGSLVPLPFFPDHLRGILELSPFAAMQNVPFRIYGGDIAGAEIYSAVLLQLFWIVTLTGLGKLMEHKAMKKVIVQGG